MNNTERPQTFKLSEPEEKVVRSYKCIRLKRWFVPPTTGFLTVTNKRVVFHCTGRSIGGDSVLISEMPMDDVAGLRVYEGLSVNWLLVAILTFLAYSFTQSFVALLPRFLVSFGFAILLMLPAASLWLLRSEVLSSEFKRQILSSPVGMWVGGPDDDDRLSSFASYARIPFYLGLAILGWRLAFESALGLGASAASQLILLGAYFYLFLDLTGRKQSFTLAIASRTMKDTGIFIPGNSFSFLPGRETIALQGIAARPAEDAGLVIRELGALLLDMQQLGDLGVAKWSS
ncbi:MAG: hypothetical protein ACRD2L_06295 [Terriglobia bacterium]